MSVLIGLASTLLTLSTLILAPTLLVDEARVRDAVERQATALLGREVDIGSLRLRFDEALVLSVEDVEVANPGWAETPAFARIAKAEAALLLQPLWQRREVVFARIDVDAPRLWLEREGQGRANWTFLAAGGGGGQRDGRPVSFWAQRIRVADGRVAVRDAPTRTNATLRAIDVRGDMHRGGQADLALDARLGDAPVRATATGGRELTARVELGEVVIDLEEAGEAWDVRFRAPSLAAFPDTLTLPFPDTPPVRLAGRVRRADNLLAIDGLNGAVGRSAFAGRLSWTAGGARPKLGGELAFDPLRAADFRAVVGVGPDDPPPTRQGGPLPEVRFDGRQLYTFDADLALAARRVEVPFAPVTDFATRLRIDAGRLELDPLRLAVADGTAAGEIALNGRDVPPSADLDLSFDAVRLGPFFRGTRFVEEMGGRFSGEVYILGVGASLDRLFAEARGEAIVRMDGGSLSGLALEAVGLDLVEALALVVGDDARVPIDCALADLAIADGRVDLVRVVADTHDTILRVAGGVDLARESLDVVIRTTPRDFSLVDVTAPVRVSGAWLDPSVEIGEIEDFPLFEFGTDEEVVCEVEPGP